MGHNSRSDIAHKLIMAAVVLCAFFPTFTFAVEPWADTNLPVKDGLELWLDAAHASGSEPAPVKGKLGVWRDASGKGRHVEQPAENARPSLMMSGDAVVVRFDGIDDHLRAVKQGAKLDSFTLVIVAAPRQNIGAFRGLVALNAENDRDYASGLNVDLGPAASARFSTVNIEGRGFIGAQNLRTRESPFAQLSTLVVQSEVGSKNLRLMVDGQWEGERPRDGQPLSMNEITVGARYYNNGVGPQHVDGFGRSDIVEILLFNRALSAGEIASLQTYLDAKHAGLKDSLPPDGDSDSAPLQTVENPPPVQMFVPGFTVREVPVELTNINNVKYRDDGMLVALAYDGNIWLLRDTNGDGLEDKTDLFWKNEIDLRSPIGMDLTPPGYERGNGVFVVGKTRCLLIVDTNGDDRADKEIEVAGGWKESFHQVDGLGVAFDRHDGSVYYGRGTYNFTDPLLRDEAGKPQYKLADESGAIIRVSPDFKSREIIATGIRFPVALRFNRDGDLFVTDQEGATWVPNGNPFDELLHIQKGRHYGFPARHPVHLPGVIDEPSTFDYTPQHQSTCGLNFNEPVRSGGPKFGPAAWAGNAIVTGYSRGKLYRTEVVKTEPDYVARTQLFACLNMLTVDACVAPGGELVIACHSGGPDWGSGPTGKGKLFKVAYADHDHPQPIFVWAVGPREIRVEFDRPVDPQFLRDVLAKSKLTAGRYVRAGDRFETLWPGYAAVQAQKLAPRFDVPLRSAQLTPDGRTLVIATDPMNEAVHYALELPGMGRPAADEAKRDGALPQHAAIDLDFDLTGCEATWQPADGGPAWTGWLPHWDLAVNRRLTTGSAPHDALWALMEKAGQLTLRGQMDLTDMLRPAIQPGSKIDYEYPPEEVTVSFTAPDAGSALGIVAPTPKASPKNDGKSLSLTFASGSLNLVPIELILTSNAKSPLLTVAWTTNEDDRPRPLPLRRTYLPWADASGKSKDTAPPPRPRELEGGSWARGYREFFGEQAMCSKCHTVFGRGGNIGPDLSNLMHRDYASVLRDITQPSFAINPDHLSYTVLLTDGRVLSGVVHTTGDKAIIGDVKGVSTELDRSEIEEMQPSSVSTMPDSLTNQLGPDRMRDLLTFLLTPPPQMPRDLPGPRPTPRTHADVNAVLAGAPEPPEKTRSLRIVLVAGPKDHGPGEHDYPAWQKAWAELLAVADNVEVTTAWEWPDKDAIQKADVLVFYQHGDWSAERAADIDAFLERGGGLVYIHWAVDGQKQGRDFADRIGLAAGGIVAFRHGEMTLAFNRETNHPIIRNFDRLTLIDETYWKMQGSLPPNSLLGSAVEENEPQPQLWALEQRNGRVFVSIPGHYSWTFDDPLFRVLLLRGIAWTAREPVDRFNELVWPGAEVSK